MDIGDFLRAVSSDFIHGKATNANPAIRLLRNSGEELSPHAPEGFAIKGSGGNGNTTSTPWIAFMDTRETVSPQAGMYLVYIFIPTLDEVVLTLNQGVSGLREQFGAKAAKERLRSDAKLIRAGLPESALAGLEMEVDFHVDQFLQSAYSVANIAAHTYQISSLPPERILRQQLTRFLSLYGDALEVKHDLLLRTPGALSVPSPGGFKELNSWEREFRPKSHADYIQSSSREHI